jgi:site-specific DNA-methyltransferase (adenine-specific)
MYGGNYGAQRATVSTNPGFRHSRSVIRVSNPRVKEGHPTQKPVALLEHIIRTFTNPGDTVLDPFMGSGSTGVACRKLGRNFIGIEIGYYWYARAEQRLMCNEQHIE